MTRANRRGRWFMLPLLYLVLQVAAFAQSPAVVYRVTPDKNPTTHFLHITLQVNSSEPSIDVAMPAWSPGSYNIHNAWRNVQEFSASDETGAALKFEKVDKQDRKSTRLNSSHLGISY